MSLIDRISINKDISLARTMPSRFYLDDNYFTCTIDRVFKKSWQFIAHKDSIKSKVTPLYFLEDTISEPLILSKQNNNT